MRYSYLPSSFTSDERLSDDYAWPRLGADSDRCPELQVHTAESKRAKTQSSEERLNEELLSGIDHLQIWKILEALEPKQRRCTSAILYKGHRFKKFMNNTAHIEPIFLS